MMEQKYPVGYTLIRIHIVFDVKHDGRHRARVVAGGYLTPIPTESVYAEVVSLRGMRAITFIAELNGLELWQTDVSSAYLEAVTTEKVAIVAGPDFGERAGHILVVFKALYGLRFSGKLFGELLFEVLESLGFTPCKLEPQIWMKRNEDLYDYVATYVDDLLLAMKDPKELIDKLSKEPYKFDFKGSGPVKQHLGVGFERDKDGTLCMSPEGYIKRMIEGYSRYFGEEPPMKTNINSPLEMNDHPGMDTSEFLEEREVNIY